MKRKWTITGVLPSEQLVSVTCYALTADMTLRKTRRKFKGIHSITVCLSPEQPEPNSGENV